MFLNDFNGSSRRMPTLFDDFSRLFEPLETATRANPSTHRSFTVDVKECEGEYKILVDLPGVARDQVDLSLEERVLEISVTAPEEEQSEERSLLKERSTVSGTRKFALPEEVNEDGIEASLEKGILSITVPKQAKKEPLKITVS